MSRRLMTFGFSLGVALAFGHGTARAQQAETVHVDAGASRHPIDPRVYGVAYADQNALDDLNAPLDRYGGNPASRYNWQQNADNRCQDWYFESIGDASATPGERGDTFIQTSKAGGAEPLVTIPTLGWVAKLGPNRDKLASFSVAKYGAQQQTDPYMPDAGNGTAANGQPITGNDPNDADVAADETFEKGWVDHIIGKWGTAKNGGLRYYILDNEPSIWHASHRDVHPIGAKMSEIRDKTIAYAAMIKAADPNAVVVGPEEWGWSGYFYSGYDQQAGSQNGWSSFPDKQANGNMDYLPWLLDQLHQHDQGAGARSLDVFSVHYYPQGGEFGNDTSSSTQLLRNRSTRSLWDPSYTDESWINDKVQLIPRLKGWVQQYYPGLAVGLTEYNWGAEDHINGATAEADILGILGREGVDLATRWTTPAASTPTYKAMKLYRNYDGNKSTFGDTSVAATVANPDNLAAFAAVRSSDGALTIMVVNKYLSGSTSLTLDLAGFTATGNAQVFQLTSANAIDHLADAAVSNGAVAATLPAQSITLFVVPGTAPATGGTSTGGTGTGTSTGGTGTSTGTSGTGTSTGTSGTGTSTGTSGTGTSTGTSGTGATGTSSGAGTSTTGTSSAATPSTSGSGSGSGCSVSTSGSGSASSLLPLGLVSGIFALVRRHAHRHHKPD